MSVYRWTGSRTLVAEPGDLIFPEQPEADEPLQLKSFQLPEAELHHLLPLRERQAAVFWDKSFLWGYLAVSTLRDLGFCFHLLTASEVRNGSLDRYRLLVVPGGWAGLKSRALGPAGLEQIRRYVDRGGTYLGLCGGAGLALQVEEGLGLLPASRKPITERLPNFSGSICVRRTHRHPFWWGLPEEASLHVWWPSQFELPDSGEILVLGRYGQPQTDFCVSELNVQQAEAAGIDWHWLEKSYEMNLNPARLLDEPAILEGRYGQGRVVLSYPHLETPGDTHGNLALFNIWYDLLAGSAPAEKSAGREGRPVRLRVPEKDLDAVRNLEREAREIVSLGERQGLWSWRSPWLLHWRRGIRGSEFGTVCVLLRALAEELQQAADLIDPGAGKSSREVSGEIEKLQRLWERFREKGHRLLEAEARDLQQASRTSSEAVPSSLVRALRTELFSCIHCYGSKSYGGLFRELLDAIDFLLLSALRLRRTPANTGSCASGNANSSSPS